MLSFGAGYLARRPRPHLATRRPLGEPHFNLVNDSRESPSEGGIHHPEVPRSLYRLYCYRQKSKGPKIFPGRFRREARTRTPRRENPRIDTQGREERRVRAAWMRFPRAVHRQKIGEGWFDKGGFKVRSTVKSTPFYHFRPDSRLQD